jgi:hypothetical protein
MVIFINTINLQIFLAKGNVPAENYNFFIDILLDTVRDEIANCLEKAYRKISTHDATRMLNLPSQAAIKEYGSRVSEIPFTVNVKHSLFFNPPTADKIILKCWTYFDTLRRFYIISYKSLKL